MNRYTLVITEEADIDLNNLYVEGFLKWGEVQADKYYDKLLAHFETLCDNPYSFRAVDEIREGYRRSVSGKHSVFYRIVGNTIEVMALVKYEDRYY